MKTTTERVFCTKGARYVCEYLYIQKTHIWADDYVIVFPLCCIFIFTLRTEITKEEKKIQTATKEIVVNIPITNYSHYITAEFVI